MKLTPQLALSFNGRCEEAFRLYERCLNGTITFMLHCRDAPDGGAVPPEWRDKVYHATLQIGTIAIAGADVPPDKYEPPRGFDVILQMDDPGAAERIFTELAAGGTIRMPLQETFWAPRFGVLTDRFGIPWVVNCEAPAEPTP